MIVPPKAASRPEGQGACTDTNVPHYIPTAVCCERLPWQGFQQLSHVCGRERYSQPLATRRRFRVELERNREPPKALFHPKNEFHPQRPWFYPDPMYIRNQAGMPLGPKDKDI